MAERERPQGSKSGVGEKSRPRTEAEKRGMKDVVGNDIPDESKERHTEIAVEIGEKLKQPQAKH